MDFSLNILIGLAVGAAAGYLGCFMIVKRMSLVGDALSHVALPGIALALVYNFNPFFGAFAFLALGVFVIWRLESKTKIPPEALVGILFTVSLAIGVLIIIPDAEILEALFGNISRAGAREALFAVLASVFIFFALEKISKGMILGVLSEDLAKSNGVKIEKYNFIYLMLVALVVALGIKITGSLLMGALVIIPAAAAKNLGSTFKSFSYLGLLIGAIASAIGVILAGKFGLPPGPVIVLVCVLIFLFTLFLKRK